MIYKYREFYKLDRCIDSIKKDMQNVKGVEIYSLPPFGVSFIEINALSEEGILNLDKKCMSKVISFCENKKIDKHLIGSLTDF